MGIRWISVIVLTTFFLFFTTMVGCSSGNNNSNSNSNTNTNTTNTNTNTNTTNTNTNKPSTGRCSIGEVINKCKDSGACKAQRDCDPKSGNNLEGTCFNKMCVANPTAESKTDKGEAPDLSCLAKAPELPKGPKTATLFGPVETFGLNGDTVGITVLVYKYNDNKGLTDLLGQFSSKAPEDIKTTDCAAKCSDDKFCLNKKCLKKEDDAGNPIGYYSLEDIPTNVALIIKAQGPNKTPTIQYNQWIPADKVKDGFYQTRAFVITTLTKSLIPGTAGIRKIQDGNAGLAGEIHDCQDRILKAARVSISLRAQKLTYFNGEGDQPDPDQIETAKDGIYAALNIKLAVTGPSGQPVELRAAIKVGGKPSLVAAYKARIFPDSISILTTQPWTPK